MRRIVTLSVVLGALAAAACGSSKDEPPKSSAAASVAGRVLEVSGTVTVGGKPLARGDIVAAVDVVETGADGSVVIELAHNHARWDLGPNKRMRVDESLAWKQPARSETVAQVEQDTVSAGRPAERNAAGTVANSSAEPAEPDMQPKGGDADAEPDMQPKGGGGEPTEADLRPKGGAEGEGSIGVGSIGTIGRGGGTGQGQGYGAGGVRGSNKTSKPKVRALQVQVQGSLATEVIQRIVRQSFGRFRACYESGLRKNPTLAGRVVTKLVIDARGAVTTAADGGSTLTDGDVVACVTRAFSRLKFPAPDGGAVTVVFPLVFSPPD